MHESKCDFTNKILLCYLINKNSNYENKESSDSFGFSMEVDGQNIGFSSDKDGFVGSIDVENGELTLGVQSVQENLYGFELSDALDSLASLTAVLGFSAIGIFMAFRWALIRVGNFILSARDGIFFKDDLKPILAVLETDTFYEKRVFKSVMNYNKSTRIRLNYILSMYLQYRLKDYLQRPASGSTKLKNKDLLENSVLLIPLKFESENKLLSIGADEIVKVLSDHCCSDRNETIMLLGNAGVGKSLFLLNLEYRLNKNNLSQNKVWVFNINAEDLNPIEVGASSKIPVGSLDWCCELVLQRIGTADASDFMRYVLKDMIKTNAIIFIDALDEMLQKISECNLDQFLNSWMVNNASLITCRVNYYHQYILGRANFGQKIKYYIKKPKNDLIKSHAYKMCEFLYLKDSDRVKGALNDLYANMPNIKDIMRTPLMMTMVIEIIGEGEGKEFLASPDEIGVYDAFLNKSIKRDGARAIGGAQGSLHLKILSDIAWKIFTNKIRDSSATHSAPATKKIILEVFESYKPILSNISFGEFEAGIYGSTLFDAKETGISRYHFEAAFAHESYMEFLVAYRLNEWMLSPDSEDQDFFDHIETAEVAFFVKEYIKRLRGDVFALPRATGKLANLLRGLVSAMGSSVSELGARNARFAAGQVGYYMGMFAKDDDLEYLIKLENETEDFWLRRSIAIGLAFGGHYFAINNFIDEVWSGIDVGDFDMARKNIAIELSFYGDQSFDKLDPTNDDGSTKCARTVTQIALQLGRPVESPNWRMDVFNIVYLARYREDSLKEFWQSFQEFKPFFCEWIGAVDADSTIMSKREVMMLIDLVSNDQI